MPDMDLVFITGMALTNKTLPRLLQLAASCRVVITGPSLPMAEILFDFGADILSGVAVSDIRRGRNAVISDRWHDIFECSYKALWRRHNKAGCRE